MIWLGYCINRSTEGEKLLMQLCDMERWSWVLWMGLLLWTQYFFYPLQCQNVTTGELPGDAGWDASSNRFLLKYRGFSGL